LIDGALVGLLEPDGKFLEENLLVFLARLGLVAMEMNEGDEGLFFF
jgi:hypothetical protein